MKKHLSFVYLGLVALGVLSMPNFLHAQQRMTLPDYNNLRNQVEEIKDAIQAKVATQNLSHEQIHAALLEA